MTDAIQPNIESRLHEIYPKLEGFNDRWATSWGGQVYVREKNACGSCNLIHFVSAAKAVNNHLATLDQDRVKWVAAPMLYQALKVQQAVEKHNCLVQLILKIIVWLCTGTTLPGQIARLEAVFDKNTYKDELIADAERILQEDNLDAYKSTAQQYLIPTRTRFGQPMNGILQHLVQAVADEGRQLIALLQEGKTWEDQEVLQLGNSCMQLACLAYQLTMKYEAVWLAETKHYRTAMGMADQRAYPWFVVGMFDCLYVFLRGGAVCNAQGEWRWTAAENNAESQAFYTENTPQDRWRRQYNAVIEQLDQQIGINQFQDTRFLSEPDDKELFSRQRVDCSAPQRWLLGKQPTELLRSFLSPH